MLPNAKKARSGANSDFEPMPVGSKKLLFHKTAVIPAYCEFGRPSTIRSVYVAVQYFLLQCKNYRLY